MEILAMGDNWGLGRIEPFWSESSFKELDYQYKPFNNIKDFAKWKKHGYWPDKDHYGGLLCDMISSQPDWNNQIIKWFEDKFKVVDTGTSYYKMQTCHYLPTHGDTYELYREIFDCDLEDCFRVIVFLEDWKSGHISEVDGNPVTNWKAGDYVFWKSDTLHMAGNMGTEDRYTLQLTGHRV
mgnify:CR=1 FL=1|jgi:hypothetical protein